MESTPEEMERLAKLITDDPEWFSDDFDDQVVIDALTIAAKKLRDEKA
jgi:hypothetical protein